MQASSHLPPLFWEVIPYEGQDSTPTPLYKGCVGHFWDNSNKKAVHSRMGFVNVRPVSAFRPASSLAPVFDDEPKNVLSWEIEGAGQSAEKSCSASTTATNSHN